MSHLKKILILGLAGILLCGCGNADGKDRTKSENKVEQTIDEQIAKEDAKDTEADTKQSTASERAAIRERVAEIVEENETMKSVTVDYDLVNMSTDMVYSTVYQFMTDSETYVGKTVRMEGTYSPILDENTQQYYHYCIVEDATKCCSQGVEFVWDDGSHVYPDEYPQENARIVVQGVFETYSEGGYDYFRLKDAVMVEE